MRVEVEVDNWLHVDGNLIGHDLAEKIFDELTIPNVARMEAIQHGRAWQARQMPEDYLLARLDGDTVSTARGYALRLKQLLREHGRKVRWIDNRVWEVGEPYGRDEYSYREHQVGAVDAIWRHQQGMYRAPTGAGKTAVILGFLWEKHPQNALILVDRVSLLDQWVDAIEKHMGIREADVGRIGSGEWREGRITIATVQTLTKRWKSARTQRLLARQSVQVLDECHHATAETYRRLVDSSRARIRIGVSATPDKTGEFALAEMTLGPIFYWDDDIELREAGVLMRPTVEIVHTPFKHPFWGDHRVTADEECEVPGCRKSGKIAHGHRNNYQDVKKALLSDDERNHIIALKIKENADHCQVVISNEINQLDSIFKKMHELGIVNGNQHTVTSKMPKAQRRETFDRLRQSSSFLLFSTIAGEGLDIPQIDRIHLPFPTKNPRDVEQKIGRGTRVFEGKQDLVIFDYADVLNPALAKQFRSRRWGAYEKLDVEIVINEENL